MIQYEQMLDSDCQVTQSVMSGWPHQPACESQESGSAAPK